MIYGRMVSKDNPTTTNIDSLDGLAKEGFLQVMKYLVATLFEGPPQLFQFVKSFIEKKGKNLQ